MFQDRTDAGRKLAMHLIKYRHLPAVILAVPRGGVPVAYEIAVACNWPLELVLIKKLGHPKNKEYAIGAVSLEDRIVIPHEDVSEAYIEEETLYARERLREMQQKFMMGKGRVSLHGRTIVVVDDGIATGNTLLVTVKVLRQQAPERIIIVAPVASRSAIAKLMRVADEVIVEMVPETFYGVGRFYSDFRQVSDEEVIAYLKKAQKAFNETR